MFGAVLARKLAGRGLTPHAYLRERVLDPAGVAVASWRTLKDGTQPLPTGAFLTAGDWLRWAYVRDAARAPTWRRASGQRANPRYGLAWWLSPLPRSPTSCTPAARAARRCI